MHISGGSRRTSTLRALLVALLFGAASAALASAPAAAQAVTCAGEPATLVGTDGDDELVGTESRDVIVGLGGHDKIWALGGDDVVCGGPGRDRINGGPGDDVLWGQQGRDRLNGATGNDVLHGNTQNDRLRGGNGNDVLRGNTGRDVLWGGRGNDSLNAGRGLDECRDDVATITNCARPGNGKTVRMGAYGELFSDSNLRAVVAELLRELGYTVEPADVPGMFAGDEDFGPEGMIDLDVRFGAGGETIAYDTIWKLQFGQGFQVPTSWATSAGFTSLEDINGDPALYLALDIDQDGKGEVHACGNEDDSGQTVDGVSVCRDLVAGILADGYPNLELIDESAIVIRSDWVVALATGRPAVGFATGIITAGPQYSWGNDPAAFGESVKFFRPGSPGDDVLWLPVDPASAAAFTTVPWTATPPPSECVGQADPCLLGLRNSEIGFRAQPAWLDAEPAVASLVEDFEWSDSDEYESWDFEVAVNGTLPIVHIWTDADDSEVARLWIAANRPRVDRLLDDANTAWEQAG